MLESQQRKDAISNRLAQDSTTTLLQQLRYLRELYQMDGYIPTLDVVIKDFEEIVKRFDRQ